MIRSIVVAEPLAEEFGRRFEAATAEDVDALADLLRLERCTYRDCLGGLLREVAR
jgi:hypothetical protein